ncbi:hypothetical protein ACFUN8_36580, partial [Streptomyces sp. NPDC057307]
WFFLCRSGPPPAGRASGPAPLLNPDINSFGLITLPEEKRASYRVRAFVYGEQSNVVHLTTGSDPTA